MIKQRCVAILVNISCMSIPVLLSATASSPLKVEIPVHFPCCIRLLCIDVAFAQYLLDVLTHLPSAQAAQNSFGQCFSLCHVCTSHILFYLPLIFLTFLFIICFPSFCTGTPSPLTSPDGVLLTVHPANHTLRNPD